MADLYNGRSFGVKRVKHVTEKAPGKRQCNCRQVARTQQIAPGMFTQTISTECEKCDNVRFVPEDVSLDVDVEAGMAQGSTIRFFEEGDAMLDGDPGDLIFRVREVADPSRPEWSRMPNTQADLHVKHTITLAEALLGFDHTLTHLDGRAVRLRKPGVVQYSDVDRIPGEGMPMSENNPKAKGDLHVEYIVRLPNELSGLSQSDKDFIHKRFA